jgi:hypothetical protein
MKFYRKVRVNTPSCSVFFILKNTDYERTLSIYKARNKIWIDAFMRIYVGRAGITQASKVL